MYRLVYSALVLLIFGVSLNSANGQCDPKLYTTKCVNEVKEGFTFLKSFNVDGKNGTREKVEYSYVFSKDTQYYLNICDEGGMTDGIVVTIYDAKRRVASTNFANEKIFPGIIFACKSTGIYYITFTFDNAESYCGGSVLAFKK
jgi:hypothetical protein